MADGISAIDAQWWLEHRSQIIAALADEGLEIRSNRGRVWLQRSLLQCKEIYLGSRFAIMWVPLGWGAFRAYKGSGWRFLQLWRVRFAVKWAYE